MKRGEVYWGVLSPRSGSEQQGRLPVIIVSHDAFNEAPSWRSVIVVPITTSLAQARRGPTAVALPEGSGGLSRESIALCHQVTTLDRSKLNERIGELEDSLLAEVNDGLNAAQALD